MDAEELEKLAALTKEAESNPDHWPEHYRLFQDAVKAGATPEQLANLRAGLPGVGHTDEHDHLCE